MPTILRIINRLNLGGPTYNAAYLSKYLPDKFETILAAGIKESHEESSEYIVEQLGIKPIYIPEMKRQPGLMSDLKSYFFIRKLIKKYHPDIVHTHAAKAGTLGRLAAIHSGVPVIVHTFHGHVFHSYFSRAKTTLYLFIERFLAKRSSAIVAISELQKRELVEKYKLCSPEKVHVIPLGFDLSRFESGSALRNDFRNIYKIPDNTLAIGIIGRLVPIKNHTLFLNAFKLVLQRSKAPVRAFIIGDGDERSRLEKLCIELGLTFRTSREEPLADVTFTSWIKNVEWPVAGMDIIALTSFNEGTPVSLIEAQAASKPVVSTEVGGIADIMLPGRSGFLVPSGDVDAFAERLLSLVENEKLRTDFGIQGRVFVMERFHYKRLAGDMADLYDRLLKPAV